MSDPNKLKWILRNRSRPERMTSARAAVSGLVEQLWSQTVEPAEEAAAAIADVVDDEFRRHCRIRSWHSGVLMVQVDDRSMVPLMRLQWSSLIRREWPKLGLRKALRRITFEHGRAGVPLAR
jgi:hypothetical protein